MKIKDIKNGYIRRRALTNARKEHRHLRDLNSLMELPLISAFDWWDTPEGELFWYNIEQ